MAEKIIKETPEFRIRLRKNPCLRPVGLLNIEFVQEQIRDGVVTDVSTYQFFMTDQELQILAKELQ